MLTPSSYAGGFYLNGVSPGSVTASAGQTILLGFSVGGAPLNYGAQVLVSGAPAQIQGQVIVSQGFGRVYAKLPVLPPGQYRVQLVIGNMVSNGVAINMN
jgi:hypothetical protein